MINMSRIKIYHGLFIRLIFFLILFPGICYAQIGQVLINEVLASNSSVNFDPDFHDYCDWIEIYNPGSSTIDMGGYYLTDNWNDTTKWSIPDGISINAGSFLIFWADGKNVNLNGCHTNFKLSKNGEKIGLYNPEGQLVDSLRYKSQITNNSFGRKPDGGTEWFFFGDPSPGLSNGDQVFQQVLSPKFSLKNGFYNEGQKTGLSCDSPGAVIRYTIDNSEPTNDSPIYTDSITISSRTGETNYYSLFRTNADPHMWLPEWVPPEGEIFKATVIRARAFEDNKRPSRIITKTYFVGDNVEEKYSTIPVISVVSEEKNLFNNSTGIYVPGVRHRPGDSESGNYFMGWERPAHIEYFKENGKIAFSQDVGIKIQGGTSPASPQKGLHVIARNDYGNNRINYRIFRNSRSPAKDLKEFKRFIIRAWGSTILAGLFNDAYVQNQLAETDLDIQAYQPAVVFINGEFWGLHEVREANKNSWYFQYHYDINRDNPGFDILIHQEGNNGSVAVVDEGDDIHWRAMINYIETHDMSTEANYEYIKTQMDVDNFIMYIGHCVYAAKWDWPDNNEASWRPRTADGKWKWIQYDMETAFGVAASLGEQYSEMGVQINMVQQVLRGLDVPYWGFHGPHELLVELLKNEEFKLQFVLWFEEHLEKEFSPEIMHSRLDTIVMELEPYMDEYRARWPFEATFNIEQDYHIQRIRDFIDQRPAYVRQHLLEEFGTLSIDEDSIYYLTPTEFSLTQNFPNPSRGSTTINYKIPYGCKIKLNIYDLSGRLVETINKDHNSGGYYSINLRTENFESGIYYYMFQTGGFMSTKKMQIVK